MTLIKDALINKQKNPYYDFQENTGLVTSFTNLFLEEKKDSLYPCVLHIIRERLNRCAQFSNDTQALLITVNKMFIFYRKPIFPDATHSPDMICPRQLTINNNTQEKK